MPIYRIYAEGNQSKTDNIVQQFQYKMEAFVGGKSHLHCVTVNVNWCSVFMGKQKMSP